MSEIVPTILTEVVVVTVIVVIIIMLALFIENQSEKMRISSLAVPLVVLVIISYIVLRQRQRQRHTMPVRVIVVARTQVDEVLIFFRHHYNVYPHCCLFFAMVWLKRARYVYQAPDTLLWCPSFRNSSAGTIHGKKFVPVPCLI